MSSVTVDMLRRNVQNKTMVPSAWFYATVATVDSKPSIVLAFVLILLKVGSVVRELSRM
jgi:hypothetical protein